MAMEYRCWLDGTILNLGSRLMTTEIMRVLGRIEGKVDCMSSQIDHLRDGAVDHGKRINKLEVSGAKNAVVAGGVASVGVALIIATVKSKIGMS